MVTRVFLSHTKKDKGFCDRFDIAAARVGVKPFRSEYETIKPPVWETIKKQMKLSSAMFLLVGEELVAAQAASESDAQARDEWKHTQNWIAYEVGIACELGIDVWVLCDKVFEINFPVPYFNNYAPGGFESFVKKRKLGFIRWVLETYDEGESFPLGYDDRKTECPNKRCGIQFNLHSNVYPNGEITCPTCLKTMTFTKGWLSLALKE